MNLITINNLRKYWKLLGVFCGRTKLQYQPKLNMLRILIVNTLKHLFYFYKLVLDKPMILNCIDMGSVFVTNSTHIFIPIIYVATRSRESDVKKLTTTE